MSSNMYTENVQGRAELDAVDTVIFYSGRSSKLYLIPTLLKSCIPAALATFAGFYIHWPVVLTRPHLLIDGIVKYGLFLQPILLVVILVLSLFSITLFVRGFGAWYSKAYRITNDRIEYEQGIFSRVVLNVELWRVRDIFFRRNFIQSLLGLGVIDIIATDETIPRLEIGPIRNAREVYNKIKKARLKSGRIAGAQAMGMSNS